MALARGSRAWPALEPLLFGAALTAYAAGAPLGLDRPAAGSAVAAGCAFGPLAAGAVGRPPLALLGMRLLAFLPVGDLATRASLASALAGALAVALLGRLACAGLARLREAESSAAGSLAEPLAAAGAAAVVGACLGLFRAATVPGAAPVTMAVVVASWICVLRLLRPPEDARAEGMRVVGEGARAGATPVVAEDRRASARSMVAQDRRASARLVVAEDAPAGAALALLAGLIAGGDAGAAPLVWVPAAALWLRDLRRGARWPLVAPVLLAGGLGVALFAVVAPTTAPIRVLDLLGGGAVPAGSGVASFIAVARESAEQLGVLALLLGGAGLLVLGARAPAAAALCLAAMAAALWLSARGSAGAGTAALGAAAVPLAVGLAHLAGKLGRARVAAVAALAVMALVVTALDGGASRWHRQADVRLASRLLESALDAVPPRGTVHPGSPQMEGLFHHARLIGLRPDVDLQP
jgi:hypothetical protein